ncbi:hypothetical protein BGX30_013634 [Mortierella sp. GBA39]|nr:hypothetical protein BGX30_013634 [Mortierella sp. GBA39]
MTKSKSPRRGASPPASPTRSTTTATIDTSIGAAAAALHAATNGSNPSSPSSPPPSPKHLKHHHHNGNGAGPTAASKEVNNHNHSYTRLGQQQQKHKLTAIVTDRTTTDDGGPALAGQDRNPSSSTSPLSSFFSTFSTGSSSTTLGATTGSLGFTVATAASGGDGSRSSTSLLSPTALGFGYLSANLFDNLHRDLASTTAGGRDQNLSGQENDRFDSSSSSSSEDDSDMDEDSESDSSVSNHPSEDEDSEEETDLDYDETSEEDEEDNNKSNRATATATDNSINNSTKAVRKRQQPSTLLKRTLNKRHIQRIQEEQKRTSPPSSPVAVASPLLNSNNNIDSFHPLVHHHHHHHTPSETATSGKGSEKEAVVLLADQSAKAKWANWSTRTLWTLIMIGGFFACFAAGPLFVILLVVMVQGLVYKEVIFLATVPSKEKKLPWFRSMHWYFLFSTNYFFYGESLIHYFQHVVFVDAFLLPFATHHRFISFTLYVIGFVFFVANLKKGHYRFQFSQFAWTHMTLLLVVCQSHFIINNIFEGLIWFFLPASLVIANDIWAYIFGFFMGRTPLIKLSPKKTVEGFVGGWLMTIVFGMLFATFLLKYPYMICPVKDLRASAFSGLTCDPNPVFIPVRYNLKPWMVSLVGHIGFRSTYVMIAPLQWHVIIMACFASLIAPFGGFFASGFKRAFKIKDFGQSIPGHGGITDRMDCQFLMGLFSYMYYQSFIKTSAVTTGLVLSHAIKLKGADQMELFDHLKQYLIGQGLLDEESCVIMPPKEAWVS